MKMAEEEEEAEAGGIGWITIGLVLLAVWVFTAVVDLLIENAGRKRRMQQDLGRRNEEMLSTAKSFRGESKRKQRALSKEARISLERDFQGSLKSKEE